jgi:hypothetical protein
MSGCDRSNLANDHRTGLRPREDNTAIPGFKRHRLVSSTADQVTFRWRDSAHRNEQKLMTLSLDEFLRRFLLHLLPNGFVRIRNFGFLANRRHTTLLPLCFHLLGTAQQSPAGPDVSSAPGSISSAAAPTVVGRWWSSRDSPLPRSNFVLHHRLPPQHETTLPTPHFGSLATFSLSLRLALNKSLLLASSLFFPRSSATLASASCCFLVPPLNFGVASSPISH